MFPLTQLTNSPFFVTWNTIKGDEKHLRGCIGTFSARNLEAGLREYALTRCWYWFDHNSIDSALRDSRFKPIALAELPNLSCSVSLLVDFEDRADYLDWEASVFVSVADTRHRLELMAFGLSSSTSEANRKQQHTCPRSCLSKVCDGAQPLMAAGWTKLEAIDSLLRKGGFKASITDDFRCKIKLTRYKSLKASATYAQWLASQ